MPRPQSLRLADRLASLRASARAGRLRARVPRYLFFAFVGVMCLAGLRAAVAPPSASSPVSAGPAVDYAAQSFAVRFARAYLTYEAGAPTARERALEPFVSTELDLGAGFSPPSSGSQHVAWAEVVQVQRPLSGGSIVTVAAQLTNEVDPVYLSVPIGRGGDSAISLLGYPSFVGPPLSAGPLTEEGSHGSVDDGEVSRLVERALSNYLAGDAEDFSADLAQAATVTLPPNPLDLLGIQELVWAKGPGSGAVLATVSASDPRGGRYTLRYEVGVRAVQGGNPRIAPGWRVTYVQTISQDS